MYYRLLIIAILCSAFSETKAQYFQFSQYNWTPQRSNIADFATSRYQYGSLVYRSQRAGDNFNLNSTALTLSCPIPMTSGPSSAFALSLLDDRAGDVGIYRSNTIGLTYAVAVPVTKYQSVSFAAIANWQSRRVNLDGLFTGSQFIPGRGFLGGASGEQLDRFNTSFFSYGLGMSWSKLLKNNERSAHIGLSVMDINRSDESFFDQGSTLPITTVINGGFTAYNGGLITIYPEALYTFSGGRSVLNLGGLTSYDLSAHGFLQGRIRLITRYVTSGYGIGGIQFEKEKILFGASYDFPVSSQIGNNGAFEFSLVLRRLTTPINPRKKIKRSKYAKRRLRNKKRKPKKTRTTKDLPPKTNVESNKSKLEADNSLEIQQDSTLIYDDQSSENDLQATPSGTAQAGELVQLPFKFEEIKLNFRFEFNKVDLTEANKNSLNELVDLLHDDPNLRVEIIGHTDDVGSREFNQKLSERRALVVRNYLMSQGIEVSRTKLLGYGEDRPIVPNNSASNRALNRRVEFFVSY